MNSKDKSPVFPYPWPWENFEPHVVTLAALRDEPIYFIRLQAARDEQLIDAKLSRSNFAEIAGELGLDEKRQDRLAFDFELIASWYLGPYVQSALKMDVPACRRALSRATKNAVKLGSALGQIDSMIGPTFNHLCEDSSIGGGAPDGSLALDYLQDQLAEIERVAQCLSQSLRPKRRGRVGDFFRDAAVSVICQALFESGAERVAVSHGKGDQAGTHLHFSNAPGQTIVALFKLLDRRIDESLLVRSFERMRKKSRQTDLAENSAQKV